MGAVKTVAIFAAGLAGLVVLYDKFIKKDEATK